MNDTLNIKYAAAYMRIIQTRWDDLDFPVGGKPEIIGTLYSIGLFDYSGTERYPHNNSIANDFGNKVLKGINIVKKKIENKK